MIIGRSSAGADTTQFDDVAQLASFAVITVRNDTTGPVNFDLRIPPEFPRLLTLHLEPGQERAFMSVLRPRIDSPQFQEFLAVSGLAHTHSARTLTELNVVRTQIKSPIDPADGRLYVFRPTAAGCDLFPVGTDG
jgi:hypothetical protein